MHPYREPLICSIYRNDTDLIHREGVGIFGDLLKDVITDLTLFTLFHAASRGSSLSSLSEPFAKVISRLSYYRPPPEGPETAVRTTVMNN